MLPPETDALAPFARLRPRLLRIAYRMLGSVAEAEDVVQEAYIRWHEADRAAVQAPEGFLVRIVTRLCLDILKSARAQREHYVGSWLPEPLIDDAEEQRDDVTYMLMLALERLSPLERAAFLLHDVFGLDFKAVAEAVGRDAAACRQLAARARRHVREARPRFPMPPDRGRDIAAAFFDASRRGDLQMLQRILATDVVAYTDGGGKVLAAIKPIYGQAKVMRMFAGLALRAGQAKPPLLYQGSINGMPGFVTLEPQNVLQSTALDIESDRIVTVYIVRNPDKLRHMRLLLGS